MTHPLITIRGLGGAARVGALISAGATSGQLRTAVQRGELIRIRKGWLGLPDAHPEVIRAAEFGGRLTCLSAARYHGLWTPDEDRRIHVGVPQHAGRVHGNPAGLVVHWQSEPWSQRAFVVEPVAELIRQMLLCSVREDALAVIDSALNKGAITRAGLARIIRTLPPRFGSVLGEVDHRSESGLETLCRVRLTPLGVPVRSQVRIAGVGRVDLVVGDRIVIEADGEHWHEGGEAFTADRSRDLALARLGYVVIRVGYAHVIREWQLVELAVRGLIARNEHRWSATHRRAGLAH